MTIFRFSLAASALLFVSSSATMATLTFEPPLHKFKSGNQLLSECNTEKSDPAYTRRYLACLGYVAGVIDQHETLVSLHKLERQFCLRPNVNLDQATDVVVGWLRRNPKERDLTASLLINFALQDAFPCRTS
ncbi:Rap1a/Tai family immunity protein [Novosphingobium sp.]|uniref:Rap1a/Tai family immunity protein n=1 Tax=Novosphingobium sp. TaxID=1874826 RepID=UPI0038F633A7